VLIYFQETASLKDTKGAIRVEHQAEVKTMKDKHSYQLAALKPLVREFKKVTHTF
jgi:hypothetical protein